MIQLNSCDQLAMCVCAILSYCIEQRVSYICSYCLNADNCVMASSYSFDELRMLTTLLCASVAAAHPNPVI